MFLTPSRLELPPHEAALRLAGTPGLAWLDGGLTHGQEGRFSFVGTAPVKVVERTFGELSPLSAVDELDGAEACSPEGALARGAEALSLTLSPRERGAAAERGTAEERGSPGDRGAAERELSAEDVPLWIGHIAYDAAWSGSARARLSRASGVPCLRFARYDALYAYDHLTGQGTLVGDDRQACERLERRLGGPPLPTEALAYATGPVRVTPGERHRENVLAALEQIHAGNVYEINLARRYLAPFSGHPLGLFLRMRALSPVPFGYLAEAPDHTVLGRSMERFLRYRRSDGALWTSPIKGTIARKGNEQAEAERLRADPKEHAEHAMVVDLMRNDMSRVSVPGSVKIRELMRVLPFAGLSHLISTVEGSVPPELTLSAIIEGTFPPGSVTGAPKLSAMRIIEELEDSPRGLYTGALGFFDRGGGFSLCVAIRTAVVHAGEVAYFAGGGIVVDSDPDRETRETDLKAQVFLQALSGT